MAKVRRALEGLKGLDLGILESGRPTIVVTAQGEIVIDVEALPLQRAEDGQYVARDLVNVLGPFEGLEGMRGPDLAWPRPTVQILPGKISGAPHIVGTRLSTESIFALKRRGFDLENLARIYPFVEPTALREGVDLEEQLEGNVSLGQAA